MRTTRAVAAALAVLLPSAPAGAEEAKVTGKIVAADLFKNGLAVIRCEVTLGKPGEYVLDHVPTPVHGTFWVEGAAPVEVAVKTRDVDVPVAEAAPGNVQDDFAGKAVTVHFKGGKRDPVSGVVLKLKRTKDEPAAGRYLVLKSGGGQLTYVDPSEVAAVESREAVDTVVRRRPRLVLTLGATDQAETKVALRYLATGLAWAPSYRIDITDPKTLTVEQRAVVKNELADLAGAELRLISGYPSVQYAHVRSPLAPGSSLATFFSELAGRFQHDIDVLSNAVVTQNTAFNVRSPLRTSLGATPTGEGVDLHYQPIGKRTLAEGDSLSVVVAGGKAEYERVVEWLVPDTRDEYGRYEAGRRGRGDRGDDDGEPWDALRFKNPLAFPMTTAPATVTAGGSFNGQRTSYWVNPGEEMVLRVEKALSVRTRATEQEVLGKGADRDLVWVGGRQYRRVSVEGELAVSNHRKEAVQVVARRRFSGDLTRADGDPKSVLLEEGVYSVNKRNELVWTVALKAGEEKTVKYAYTVLVAH